MLFRSAAAAVADAAVAVDGEAALLRCTYTSAAATGDESKGSQASAILQRVNAAATQSKELFLIEEMRVKILQKRVSIDPPSDT